MSKLDPFAAPFKVEILVAEPGPVVEPEPVIETVDEPEEETNA